jgi:flagellar biosynthesis component FlhA
VWNFIIFPDVPLTVTGDATGFDGAFVGSGVFVVAGIVFVVAIVVTVTIFCEWTAVTAGAVTTAEVSTGDTFSFDSPAHPAKRTDATSKTIIRRYFIASPFI